MKMNPQFHHLAAALDSRQMSMRIQNQWTSLTGDSIEIKEFNVARVFPRPGSSFAIQYRMRPLNARSEGYSPTILCGLVLGQNENWPKHVEKNKHRVMVFDDLRLVVPVFPFDPELPAIAEVCVTGQVPKLFQGIKIQGVPGISTATVDSFEVLGYRLERRCVIKHKLGSSNNNSKNSTPPNIVAKITRAGRMKETEKGLALLEENGFAENDKNALTISKSYYLNSASGIQVSEFAPGETLHNLTVKENFAAACRSTASILKKLHEITSASLPAYTIEDELNKLAEKVTLISSVFPELASDLESALEVVESSARELNQDFQPCCIHRDFYDKQVLYVPARTTLLDYDTLASGDPAQDCGNFAAHLVLRGMQDPANLKNIKSGLKAFEITYGIPDDEFSKRKLWWQSASLIRLACLYSLRPKWQMLAQNLVNSAILTFRINQTQTKGAKENYVL